MKTVAFTTLGCKVNQYDTDAVKGMFLLKGYQVVDFDDVADIYVINTCSVTAMGEKKSRQLIRKGKRNNENARIVVMGCYAQLDPETVGAIEGVNLVVGTNNRHQIVELVEALDSTEAQINTVRNIMQELQFEEMPLYGEAVDKARAYMKIQEGCNNYCTFCIIPYTRGKLKSRKLADIVAEGKRLTDAGYSEIILTGIHLGNYGLDLKEKTNLADVVEALLANPDIRRIRLGSIESVEVSPRLIELMRTNERLCSQLHLPLQAGSDKVLKAMNRHYTLAEFKTLAQELRNTIPDLSLTTDVIVGFPGEDDEAFAQTLATLEELHFTHIHVFPYSKREGTPAAKMVNQVPEVIKKSRVAMVNQLSRKGFQEYGKRWLNRKTTVLIETEDDKYYMGYTEHYLMARIPKGVHTYKIGAIIPVSVISVEDEYLLVEEA